MEDKGSEKLESGDDSRDVLKCEFCGGTEDIVNDRCWPCRANMVRQRETMRVRVKRVGVLQ